MKYKSDILSDSRMTLKSLLRVKDEKTEAKRN